MHDPMIKLYAIHTYTINHYFLFFTIKNSWQLPPFPPPFPPLYFPPHFRFSHSLLHYWHLHPKKRERDGKWSWWNGKKGIYILLIPIHDPIPPTPLSFPLPSLSQNWHNPSKQRRWCVCAFLGGNTKKAVTCFPFSKQNYLFLVVEEKKPISRGRTDKTWI